MKVNFNNFNEYLDYLGDLVLIHTRVIESIDLAIKDNKNEAKLLEVYFTGQDFVYEILLDKADWKASLERSIEVFTENNESDKAIDAYQLKALTEGLLELEKSS